MKTDASFKRKDSLRHIKALAPKIAEHVMKIFMYPHTKYVDGWTDELSGWYDSVADAGFNLKKGDKLSYDALFEALWWPMAGNLPKMYSRILKSNQEITVSHRYPKKEIPVLEAMVASVYVQMTKSLVANQSWLQFVGALRKSAHVETQ